MPACSPISNCIRPTKSCSARWFWQNFGLVLSAATRTRRSDNLKRVDELAAKYESLPFDNAVARDYAAIRAHLFNTGRPIGPNDMMIAAIARSRGATLVTHNTAEFSRVPGLSIDDWQSPQVAVRLLVKS